MLETRPSWIQRAKELLRPPSNEDDRLPSEHLIGFYALRGYRGDEVLVSARPYPRTVRVDAFLARHVKTVIRDKLRIPDELMERDALAIAELAEQSDAVRIVPAY
jgi:hypothetical protein